MWLLNTTWAIVVDTFREAFARKVFWAVFALSTVIILFFLFLMKIDIVEGATATMSVFGKGGHSVPVERLVRQTQGGISSFLFTWGMFLAVFASSGLIPSVLEPGRIELLLSKPVPRWLLLAGRFLGNLLVVGLNITYLVLGIWVILGVKTHIWQPLFFVTVPITLFTFAVLLCVVVYLGVLWENAAVATMVTTALMIFSPLLAQTDFMMKLLSSEWSRQLWKLFYYLVPKVYGLGRMTQRVVTGDGVDTWMPVWSSFIFGAVVLSHALWIFRRRDY
jgi:ABC-2 type transport system permease protein